MKTISYFSFFFLLAQLTIAQGNSSVDEVKDISRDPVQFTHQPFLLLKITPTSFFEGDRNFRYGVEIAPPFGKFSFSFDYGKGKDRGISRKPEKFGDYERSSTQYRGEIRMYFSDWYPFYALDKKPFGRYYAIEYVHKTITRNEQVNTAYNTYPFELPVRTPFLTYDPFQVNTLERAINLKFGKHFHITRFLFIDAFAGLGIGLSQSTTDNFTIPEDSDFEAQNKWTFGFPSRSVLENNIFLSKTAGLRLALVL